MRKRVRLDEIWKPVIGYEGWYEVSNLGRVKRVKAGPATRIGRILNLHLDKDGYDLVYLSRDNKLKTLKVHILVCEAFRGPKPTPAHQVNHDNGVKNDNWEGNVEWFTGMQNITHAQENGLTCSGNPTDVFSRTYKLTSPVGKVYIVKGALNEFAKRHNLYSSHLYAVARGATGSRQHGGWRCEFIGK